MSWRRVSERDVPQSQHTIFVRGLPGSTTTDQIREFFEKEFGEVTFDFVKVSPDRTKLYVAIRFSSKQMARECMDKYADKDIMGHIVELTWFRDIRRYISHCQKQGIPLRGEPGYRGNDSVRRGRSRSRTRSRSYHSSVGRDDEGDPDDQSRSVSISPEKRRNIVRRRSHSADTGGASRSRSRTPQSRSRSQSSDGPSSAKNVSRSPSPPPKKSKKERKKEKKRLRKAAAAVRHTPSVSRSPSRSPLPKRYAEPNSDMEVESDDAITIIPAANPRRRQRKDSPPKSSPVKMKTKMDTATLGSVEVSAPIIGPSSMPPSMLARKNDANYSIRNSSFAIDLDSNKLPERRIKYLKQEIQEEQEEMMNQDNVGVVKQSVVQSPSPVPAVVTATTTRRGTFHPIGYQQQQILDSTKENGTGGARSSAGSTSSGVGMLVPPVPGYLSATPMSDDATILAKNVEATYRQLKMKSSVLALELEQKIISVLFDYKKLMLQ